MINITSLHLHNIWCRLIVSQVSRICNYLGDITTLTLLDKNVEITALCIVNQGLAVGYLDGDIVVWDVENNKSKGHYFGHKASITCLAYNSNTLQLFSV